MCAVINSNAAAANLLLQVGGSLEQLHKNGMSAFDYATLTVAESANDEAREQALATAAVLSRWRARSRLQALARYVRVSVIRKQFEDHLLLALDQVLYRPGGRGAAACRAEFEELAAA